MPVATEEDLIQSTGWRKRALLALAALSVRPSATVDDIAQWLDRDKQSIEELLRDLESQDMVELGGSNVLFNHDKLNELMLKIKGRDLRETIEHNVLQFRPARWALLILAGIGIVVTVVELAPKLAELGQAAIGHAQQVKGPSSPCGAIELMHKVYVYDHPPNEEERQTEGEGKTTATPACVDLGKSTIWFGPDVPLAKGHHITMNLVGQLDSARARRVFWVSSVFDCIDSNHRVVWQGAIVKDLQ